MKKEFLEKEIEASKNAVKSMKETMKKCEEGIELQEFVLSKFEEKLTLY